jgi:hypothetical protein
VSPGAALYARNKSFDLLSRWPESPFRKVGDTLYERTPDAQLLPLTSDRMLELAAGLKPPATITTTRDGKYVQVIARKHT